MKRIAVGISTMAMAMAVTFVGIGPAIAHAGPPRSSGNLCKIGGTGNNLEVCFEIDGQGLFVDDMQATAIPLGNNAWVQACIVGPPGVGGFPICTDWNFGAVGEVHFFNQNMPAGTYCADLWWSRNPSNAPHNLEVVQCASVFA